MKKIILLLFMVFSLITSLFANRYEPIIGTSGSVLDVGSIRFPIAYEYGQYNRNSTDYDYSQFDFGLDFGIGQSTELQNRIDYNKTDGSDFRWINWTEMVKFALTQQAEGTAYSLGVGARIPVSDQESLGLIGGFFISSAIKDIDFDFNIGLNPYITSANTGSNETQRPNTYINIDLLLGYRLLPFLKIMGGFESEQLFNNGSITYNNHSTVVNGGSIWDFVIGGRLKPQDYPFVVDLGIYFRSGNDDGVLVTNKYDWKFKLGIQLLPQGAQAGW